MRKYLFLLFFVLWSHSALANTCAWVSGSTKNWSDTTAWTGCGGVAPTAVDDVTVSGTGTLTVNGTSGSPSLARGVDFTGFTGTATSSSSLVWTIGDPAGSGAGVFTVVSGMTWSINAAATINFISITGTTNLSTGGKTFPIVNWNGAGGTWSLQDNYASASSRLQSLLQGTLNMNNHNLTASGNFASGGSGTRALIMGSGTLSVGGYSVGTSGSGLTITANSSTLSLPTGTASYDMGGQTYNIVAPGTGASTDLQTFNDGFTAATITATPNNTQSVTLIFGGNVTATTSFTATGADSSHRIFIRSSARGTQRTITAAAVSSAYSDWQDILAAGAASWNLSAITGNSGNCGDNTSITFTTPSTVYAKTGASANWSSSIWFTSSGGAGVAHVPLCQDTARFDANSITAGSVTISGDVSRIGTVNWTGVTNTPLWAKTSAVAIEIYGDITMVAGMTSSGTSNNTTFALPGATTTLTTAGQSWGNPVVIDSGTGTMRLGDNLTASNTLTITTGTLDLNSHTYTGLTTISQTGGTFTLSGTISPSSTTTISGGTVNLSAQLNDTVGITLSGGTTNDSGAAGEYKGTTFSCTGGTHTVRKLTLSSTFARSSTCDLTFPVGGNGTYATSWTDTGTSGSFTAMGKMVRSAGAYTVTGTGSYTYGD